MSTGTGTLPGLPTAAPPIDVRLVLNGELRTVPDVPADLTVLDWLREHEHRTGTKEGCREGDCGACTVVVADIDAASTLRFRPVDACITLLRSVDGCAVWTVEGLADDRRGLHPVQQAIVDHHASQCGFCTPGIVMALFAAYEERLHHPGGAPEPITRGDAERLLAGTLCRCTGYRSVVEAATTLHTYPPRPVDRDALAALLAGISPRRALSDVLRERAERPAATVVAGGTDVVVAVNDDLIELGDVLLLHGVPELEAITEEDDATVVGAAAPLEAAWAALARHRPTLSQYADRFAGPQVRAMGTLGGNLVTASPVGDSIPVLLALDARVRLASVRGERWLPVAELLTGYRHTALAPDELLVAVAVPHPRPGEQFIAAKHSRRHDDDIATVTLAVRVVLRDGQVVDASVAAGGASAVPMRAPATEAALRGRAWSRDTVGAAAEVLAAEVTPISDVRAGADHRRAALAALLRDTCARWGT